MKSRIDADPKDQWQNNKQKPLGARKHGYSDSVAMTLFYTH